LSDFAGIPKKGGSTSMTFARLAHFVCCLALMVLCFNAVAIAQTETATISGLITDDTGAVVPGAEVKLLSVDRGTTTPAATNNAGIYVFASVHPGQYQLTVHKPGFKQVDFLGLVVNVQDHIEQNFRLQVGSVSESVTVEASAATLNTTDATVSTVVDRQFAENLPMNGRSFQTLIQLTPGVVLTTSNIQDSGQFSVNGQRAAANYWMVDGVSANIGVSSGANPGNGLGGTLGSFSALGGTNSLVSVDAMQEFRIQTSTYAPEFGRTPGGQISIVTRSGTNQFHGTLFDYVRNDALDANNWFNGVNILNPTLIPKAKERQNDFGGTFSGPIVKDKTFFFFSYEGLRLQLPQTTLTTVPDLLARQSAVPAMQPYLNAFPFDPNQADLGNGTARFNASYSNPATLDAYSLRVDQKLTDRVILFGRYNYSPSELALRGGPGGADALSVVQPISITTQTVTLGLTWMISPTFTNDLRFNYSRTNGSSSFHQDSFGGAVPLQSLPFPGSFSADNAVFHALVLSLSQFGNALDVGENAHNLQRQINITDSLSVQKGSHSLRFGADFRRLSPVTSPALYSQQVFFLDVPSFETGDILAGETTSATRVALLFHNLGIYAQDTWRVVPRVTVTYGLRWDIDFAPSSLNGPSIPAVTGYNLNDFSQLAVAPAGTAPFKTTYGNVAPRVGLAYQASQKQDWGTVIRGGFGVFYDLASSEAGNLLGVSIFDGVPPFGAFNFLNGPFPFTPAQIAAPPIPSTATISNLYVFNPNLKLPYTLEWNVALEQALGRQQTLSVSYIGAAGRRLLQTTAVFFPTTNTNISSGDFIDNTADSDYNALQVQFQRRLAQGLQVLASYTWAHSIDDGSTGSAFAPSNEGAPGILNSGNRGPSDFDIRNAFSAGVTYDIPGPKTNAFVSAILGNWSVQNVIQGRSAPPVDVVEQNFSVFNNGVAAAIRPDLVPGQPLYLYGAEFPGGKAFNPAAFTTPPIDPTTGLPIRQGNLTRNALRGFGAAQWDFAVHRIFPIHEALKLEFRAEMFNVLNHPNFGPPPANFGFSGFGVSTQTLGQSLSGFGSAGAGAFNPLYQIGGPRSIQFALKLMF